MHFSMAESQTISIRSLLDRLADKSHGPASAEEVSSVLTLIFEGKVANKECKEFLTLLESTGRGQEPDVVAKCAIRMRDAGERVKTEILRDTIRRRHMASGSYKGGLVDIVGTGGNGHPGLNFANLILYTGDGHSTFNVSTTASIIASSLLLVCKHGAKSSSSKSGAADLLQALPGAPKIEKVTAQNLAQVFEISNYAFAFASVFHPGMAKVALLRRELGIELGIKTVFNILGPLANPAHQLVQAGVYGVANRGLGRMYAEALIGNGCGNGLVVCGAENLDEISIAGRTYCWRVKARPSPVSGNPTDDVADSESYAMSDAPAGTLVDIEEFQLEPQDFGLPSHELSEVMPGGTPQENARTLMKLLNNELPPEHPVLHFVLINTAALFVISGICDENVSNMGKGDLGQVITEETRIGGGRWKEGVRRARWCIESGEALRSLERYIDFTNNV